MHLQGGVGEASFQPAGYSRPNSDCKGKKFTPPPNEQNRITYLDYSEHLREKAMWSTENIRRVVVPYQLSAKVIKKIGYITKQGKKLVIPDLISIERSTVESSKDEPSEYRTSINNMELDIMNEDLEGHHDSALGTIVFNKTGLPRTECEQYRSVAEIEEGLLLKSKLKN